MRSSILNEALAYPLEAMREKKALERALDEQGARLLSIQLRQSVLEGALRDEIHKLKGFTQLGIKTVGVDDVRMCMQDMLDRASRARQ
jgi:hypothetical protein